MTFRQRLAAGALTVGSFVKTPHPHVVEVLGLTGLDCVVLDAEHAPFDRAAIDLCTLAARATGMPVLVRPAHSAPETILQALDGGADGVLLPHVRSVADAELMVRLCRYGPGGRGYAGSTRAADYTTRGMARHLATSNPVIVLQIEDADALEAIEAIAAVPGVDALFIGRADLTVSLGAASPDDPQVVAAVERICAAGRAAGRTIGMFLPRVADVAHWQSRGASLFLLQSDQEFLLKGAAALLADAGRG
jgi:2-keto-3-deoxy-L-rhamnonate aldolase RhmA